MRGIVLYQPAKTFTQIALYTNRNGAPAWDFASVVYMPSELRRIALAASGTCTAELDWLRLYEWPDMDFDMLTGAIPSTAPMTGARLFNNNP